MRSQRVVAAAAAFGLALVGYLTASGEALSPASAMTSSTSHTDAAFAEMPANPSIVRQVGHIPAAWKLRLDRSGKAILFVQMYDGQATFNGRTSSYRWASVSAAVDSAALPPGVHTTSDVEGIPSDFYMLSWTTDSAALATWMRAGTGLGSVVSVVPTMSFKTVPGLLDTFRFAAPSPAPSPFMFVSTITPAFFPITADAGDFWRETSTGIVKIQTNDHNEQLGAYVSWRLNTVGGTPLARMIGAASTTGSCSATNVADPLLGLLAKQNSTGCLGRELFTSTTITKAVHPVA